MNKYIFMCSKEWEKCIFNDLKENDNLIFHEPKKNINSKFKPLKVIKKIASSVRLNEYIRIPFNYHLYDICNYNFNPNNEYYVILTNLVLPTYGYYVINKISKKKNVHVSLILIDPVDSDAVIATKMRKSLKKLRVDNIFTFSKSDSEKYNYIYLNEHYYSNMKNNVVINNNPKNDIYWIGTFKPGRYEIVNNIYEYLVNRGIKLDFEINIENIKHYKEIKDNLKKIDGINYYEDNKSYIKSLNELQNSKCIIEILQDKQKDQTLRYFEAVVFNKKLLTNNPNVKNLNFYNPKYMKYFEKIEDIDIDWLKEDINVDYHYNNEFSPNLFLKELKTIYEKTKED